MNLTLEQVEHISELARLALTDEEKDRYRQQLAAILGYFAQLQDVDTSDIPPTSNVLTSRSVLRKDEPRSSLRIDDLLINASETEDNQFLVPPIFE
jgi:aspartyl-tRNA(Asn)/glutamyl-tRNA(Gln) amidotransferase subunit C